MDKKLAIALTKEIYNKYPKIFHKLNNFIIDKNVFKTIVLHIHAQTNIIGFTTKNGFEKLPFNMLYGLLEDFFEENNYILMNLYDLWKSKTESYSYFIVNNKTRERLTDVYFHWDRKETQYKLIMLACEILENRLKDKQI